MVTAGCRSVYENRALDYGMEFGFEVSLCSHLEATTDWIIARQLGAAVAVPGNRIIDICCVVPNALIDTRTQITPHSIPTAAIDSAVGPGDAVYWRDAFDCHPDRARTITEHAIDIGFFEVERNGGRRYVRQAVRYPQWYDRLIGIENKPDLSRPGKLEQQLRLDVSLGIFDEVILATESYVTRAHLNRIPDEVGVWRFDPQSGDRTVIRDPQTLPTTETGVELRENHSLKTDIALITAEQKQRKRKQLAERSYGKGWRTYDFPACVHGAAQDGALPYCTHYGCIVDAATDCGGSCPAFDRGDVPTVDTAAIRDDRSPWVQQPDGIARTQSGLDRFF